MDKSHQRILPLVMRMIENQIDRLRTGYGEGSVDTGSRVWGGGMKGWQVAIWAENLRRPQFDFVTENIC